MFVSKIERKSARNKLISVPYEHIGHIHLKTASHTDDMRTDDMLSSKNVPFVVIARDIFVEDGKRRRRRSSIIVAIVAFRGAKHGSSLKAGFIGALGRTIAPLCGQPSGVARPRLLQT